MICKYNNAYGDKCSFVCIHHKNGFIPLQKIEWWSQGCEYSIELEAWENVLLISQWRRVNEELRKLKEENEALSRKIKCIQNCRGGDK